MLRMPPYPSQELFFKVDVGGKTMYGRVPLMNNPDEAVPRPLIGWTGTLPDKTGALLQLHNDLVQSLLQLGVLRPVERPLADKISMGTFHTNAILSRHPIRGCTQTTSSTE